MVERIGLTVGELIEKLQEHDSDIPVRMAIWETYDSFNDLIIGTVDSVVPISDTKKTIGVSIRGLKR